MSDVNSVFHNTMNVGLTNVQVQLVSLHSSGQQVDHIYVMLNFENIKMYAVCMSGNIHYLSDDSPSFSRFPSSEGVGQSNCSCLDKHTLETRESSLRKCRSKAN